MGTVKHKTKRKKNIPNKRICYCDKMTKQILMKFKFDK